jgi:hypothetical protein
MLIQRLYLSHRAKNDVVWDDFWLQVRILSDRPRKIDHSLIPPHAIKSAWNSLTSCTSIDIDKAFCLNTKAIGLRNSLSTNGTHQIKGIPESWSPDKLKI